MHVQLKEMLAQEIKKGIYKNKIPSERELMDRFSISRTTVRTAISLLVQDGMLEKIHGKGTFISKRPPVHDWLDSLNSLTDTIKRMGMVPGSRLLKNGITGKAKDIHINEFLNTDMVYTIERLRTADGIPIAVEKHFYDKEIGLQLEHFDLHRTTIYDLLENRLNIDMMEAEQFITCKEVRMEDALHLDIPKGTTVLSVERLITDTHDKPIEYYISYFRPDMYVFRIKTRRNK